MFKQIDDAAEAHALDEAEAAYASAVQAYIGQFNPLAAQRMALPIIAATENVVGVFPHAGRSIGGGRYEFSVVRPYALRYRVEGDEVVILRVRHGAREAEY